MPKAVKVIGVPKPSRDLQKLARAIVDLVERDSRPLPKVSRKKAS
jgi:hypothetical protein